MTALSPLSETPPYLAGLNPDQRAAVEATDGPVLVLAGAGTGKTRVLTTRLAHILQQNKAFPSQILAVTFTNKAAGEMRERVSSLLGGQMVEGWWLGTFHALAARMLRRHAGLVGLNQDFTILDDDDQMRVLKQIAEAQGVDVKKSPPKLLLSLISRWKDRGLRPQDVGQADAGVVADGKLVQIYTGYQERLRTLNACDFGDLLLHMLTIFRDPAHADVLASYHHKFRYILVDEYQDTNTAQYLWLRLLAQRPDANGPPNICCVGDDDQSIYGWRGAEVGNILRFERDFPGAKIIRLEQNYRSTQSILAAASGVIAHNQGRLGKTLWSEGEAGDKVRVRILWDSDAEAKAISDDMEGRQRVGEKLSTMAVLVRAGFQMRAFEERFVQIGLPYRVIGGPRFYERQEIRDALAYFRVVVQPADDLALERIINTPKRGLGDAALQSLHGLARGKGIPLHDALQDAMGEATIRPAVRAACSQLANSFARWRGLLGTLPHTDLAAQILDESGYTAMWQADKSPEAPGRLENLKELVSGMAEFDSLPAFLEHVALVMENNAQNANQDAVTIMTLHGAKGLEFNTVYLPGWEEGLFPSQRSMDENGVQGLEEERRLAYVGLTRARRSAMITSVANRRTYGNWVQAVPSRFIDELPADVVDQQSELRPTVPQWSIPSYHNPELSLATSAVMAYRAGQRVRHDSFGGGRIVHVAGQKLDILFDDGSHRRVMASFIDLLD